jgi:hypothetical protein
MPGRVGEITPMSDDYLLDAAWKHWETILRMYRPFEKHRPIVLFDIQEQRIYLYPYKELGVTTGSPYPIRLNPL